MQVELAQLAGHTVFDYQGKTWRKGYNYRGDTIGCEPKLGGQFQSALTEFLPKTALVTVE